ncbi:unannotated protein [freshwater metagenome]|uniref:Unannotated protein n=1 Tax=freshwater metagenome TaxID=449393 RepID=A0A6J7RLV3_9ZZZZ
MRFAPPNFFGAPDFFGGFELRAGAAEVRAGAPLLPFGIPVFAPGAGLRARCATTLIRSLHSFSS